MRNKVNQVTSTMPALSNEEFLGRALEYVTRGYTTDELVFVVKPRVRLPEVTRVLLKHHKIAIVRSDNAPIEGFYLIPREDYNKHA